MAKCAGKMRGCLYITTRRAEQLSTKLVFCSLTDSIQFSQEKYYKEQSVVEHATNEKSDQSLSRESEGVCCLSIDLTLLFGLRKI